MDEEATSSPRKTKRERFLTIAEGRTVKILKGIVVLGRCSNRASYEYTPGDIDKIFSAIQQELDHTKRKFYRDKEVKFSLSGEEVDS